ncbi:Phosphatidylinositol-4-phosphate binding protein [Phytophthora megakarya]|uniref:Phosphatidylinositol-4-phosphate binding protein n=1 Tax=Phytophthora megakarya TaxID=4795 RepID=A0A225WHJ4_9STRA|nr:Phosphatidylinositol-4-phosphate binding protein [Phytophthora megakarya]
MVGFTTYNGQEIGFVAFASIDVPECPELGCLKLKRLRMKRTMLVIPAKDAPDTTSEIFVMCASEAPYITNTRYRFNMAILNDISLVIDSHNITRQPLVLHKDWVPNNTRPLCSICSRKFQFVSRRRHHCRMCGDIVCKTCYVKRSVRREEIGKSQSRDALAICQTKFCLRCITNLRAIDKRFDNFSPQVSKMLSISVDTLNISTTEEFIDLDSPDSYPRSSSFFAFYNDTHSQHNSKRTSVEFPWNTTADRIDPREKVTGGGVGTLASRSSEKKRSSSLSINLVHPSSYPRLRGLSRLSRRSSIASICSQSELYEEKMVFGHDEKTHTPTANEAGDQWFALIR